MKHEQSNAWYQHACHLIPGGVDSPVRAFANVQTDPIFIDHASGSHIYDVDGNDYLDYICSWGPMILGHAHPFLQEGLESVIQKGISYGLCTPNEVALASLIVEAYDGIDMVRMVNSGTEATMSAIRVARGYTKRDKIVKFEGCYHGHSDGLLVRSGSGALTFGTPTSPGVPADIVKNTLVCQYNSIASFKACIEANLNEIGCVIIEPIAGNMGLIPAERSFLLELRALCDQHGIVLIFDEVISGFRIAYGGAAQYYGVKPDMACFGKIIGAGLPVGAYGGRKEIMEMVSPIGPVYQAGTLSGNPLAMYLGTRLLTYLRDHQEIYQTLNEKGRYFQRGIQQALDQYHLPYRIHQCGSLLTLFFCDHDVHSYQDVEHLDKEAFIKYFRYLLEHGILIPPSPYECMFLSDAHTKKELDQTISIIEGACQVLVS